MQWEPEARQDITASQRLLFGKDDRFGDGGVDSDGPSTWIDEPGQAATRVGVPRYSSQTSNNLIAMVAKSVCRGNRIRARRTWCASAVNAIALSRRFTPP
jgi:hypothetical protein